jgi:TolB-like protein
MKFIHSGILLLSLLLTSACTTTVQSSLDHQDLDRQANWAILPIANNTDTPQAGLSAEAMVEHLARRRGIANLSLYPAALSRDSLFEPTERKVSEEAIKWARTQGIRYAITGSVEEWRYKVGIDGEPAVGLTLKVIDLSNDKVVWSGSGAKSGWSRQALSAVAQSLITELLSNMKLNSAK